MPKIGLPLKALQHTYSPIKSFAVTSGLVMFHLASCMSILEKRSDDEEAADGTAACDQSIVAAATSLRRKQRYTHMSCRVVVETYMNTRYT